MSRAAHYIGVAIIAAVVAYIAPVGGVPVPFGFLTLSIAAAVIGAVAGARVGGATFVGRGERWKVLIAIAMTAVGLAIAYVEIEPGGFVQEGPELAVCLALLYAGMFFAAGFMAHVRERP